MTYIFDTNIFASLFKNYYRKRFPTLWENFDDMVFEGQIISTREVKRELEDQSDDASTWAKENQEIFLTPTAEVARFVAQIYTVQHFQANIEQKKLLKGGKNADPFIVATAATLNPNKGTVVTLEAKRAGAVKIPNICEHFSIPCLSLEEFMEVENWTF